MQESIKRDSQTKITKMREEFSEKLQSADRKITEVMEKTDSLEQKVGRKWVR